MILKKNINFSITIILLTFILCLIYANFNIKNYDKNVIDSKNTFIHQMLKNDPGRYFYSGYQIKKQLKEKVSYFDTKNNNFTKYLYPRIIAFYYLIFDYDFFEDSNEKKIKIGVHHEFLIFQISLYYLSLIFLYFQLKKKIESNTLFLIIFFLCVEPTIFQYHGSFWSESIFFSLQILIMGLVLSDNHLYYKNLVLGFLLGLLALQRSNGFYYFIPILVFLFFINPLHIYKRIAVILIGYLLIIHIPIYHNYKETGKYFLLPKEIKAVLHAYVVPEILDENQLNNEKKKAFKFMKDKGVIITQDLIDKKYNRLSFSFCDKPNEEANFEVNFEICNYFNKRSKEILISNPIETLKFIVKRSLSFSLLNPFHIYADNLYLSEKYYYRSELHKKLTNYRVSYSLTIYFICFVGFIHLLKSKRKDLIIFVILSSLYFFIILSWHGNNRYFVPILIYQSIFFSYGLKFIFNYFNKTKFSKKNF